MRNLSTLLIALALVTPAFAETTHESNLNSTSKPAAVHKVHKSHMAKRMAQRKRPAAKPAASTATKVSSLNRTNDPDYPWVLPA